MASMASKHLGRVKGAKTLTGSGMFTSPATTEIYPNAPRVDWFLKGANYYYMAITRMREALVDSDYGALHSSLFLGSPLEVVGQILRMQTLVGLDEIAVVRIARRIEDLMAATTILHIYQLFDANEAELHAYVFQGLYRLAYAELTIKCIDISPGSGLCLIP